MPYMLDTDICIYIGKNRPAEVRARFEKLGPGSVLISVITYGELFYGASKSENPEGSFAQLDLFLQGVQVEPLTWGAARQYGHLQATLERKGRMIGNNDLWIAAHALDLGLTLVTNNEREFHRVPGLKIENWAA